MTPATLLAEIKQADGEVWMDGDRLKFRAVPARLIPAIREHKTALLVLLSAPAHDDYAAAERLAIQEESAEISDHPGKPVPSLEKQAEKVLAHYGVDDLRIVARNPVLASHVEKMGIDATNTTTMQPRASMALPERVTCSSCAEFVPGREPNSLGKCSRTANGLPPVASRGYGCCFPHAPRCCPDFKEADHED